MTNKQKQAPKKPPAHEVILKRLGDIKRGLQCPLVDTRIIREDDGFRMIFGALIWVLDEMHLPEKEIPTILAKLRALHMEEVCPSPQAQRRCSRLLERLGGHDLPRRHQKRSTKREM
ncbi:MAG: hypothetical protein V1723_01630 [Candidatus Uhrbacteria bacterium]